MINDAATKRLRAKLRRHRDPCHVCGGDINYDANHLDPLSFQMDHLWPVALGGPPHDEFNVAASHRACNRRRSNTCDAIAVNAAAQYGYQLTPTHKRKSTHAPDGQPCNDCAGAIHNPAPGVTFITGRCWWNRSNTPARVTPPATQPPASLAYGVPPPAIFFPNAPEGGEKKKPAPSRGPYALEAGVDGHEGLDATPSIGAEVLP